MCEERHITGAIKVGRGNWMKYSNSLKRTKGAVISADLPSQMVTAGGKTYKFQNGCF